MFTSNGSHPLASTLAWPSGPVGGPRASASMLEVMPLNRPPAAVGKLELALLLKGPEESSSVATDFLALAGALPFADKKVEKEFTASSTQSFMSRLPLICVIVFVSLVAILASQMTDNLVDAFVLSRLTIYAILGAFVFLILGATQLRIATTSHTRAILEMLAIVACPMFVFSMPTAHAAAFATIFTLFIITLLLRPSRWFMLVTTISTVTAWIIVVAGGIYSVALGSGNSTFDEAFMIIVVLFVCGFVWFSSNIADRMAFSNERAISGMWCATHRMLAAALPHQILPALVEHFGNQDWGNMPATAEPDVSIIFVRLPALSHPIFSTSAKVAVGQLNSLWELCDATAVSCGVTKLELTNTEFVGIVGLGLSAGGTNEDTARAARAGLRIISALPPAFAAVVTVGVHSGPVTAGFVGTLRPRYTLVGDTMNTTSRIASVAAPGTMTVSSTAFARISNLFNATRRDVYVKGMGAAIVYDVMHEHFSGVEAAKESAAQLAAQPVVSAPTSGAADPLSKHFSPQPFTILAGFADKDTETRYAAQVMATKHSQFIALLLLILLLYLLTNNGDAAPSVGRFAANAVLIAFATALGFASLFAPRNCRVIAASKAAIVIFTLVSPFFAQRNRNIAFAGTVLLFSPNHYMSLVVRSSLNLVHTILVTILHSRGYYFSNPQDADGSTEFVTWLWISWISSLVGHATLETQLRNGFARAEALVTAKEAAAGMLVHLLPSSLIERLAAGDEITALTTENEDVAILVADVVGFTALSASATSPAFIFDIVNNAFREFERVAHAEGAFKVKTLGDCIFFAAGLHDFPGPASDRMARVALLARVARGIHGAAAHLNLRMRVGIHVGSLVSGVMNSHGFLYDVWGEDTLCAIAVKAAAPPGGTAFTTEAAAVLRGDLARCVRPDLIHRGADGSVMYFSMIEPVRALSPGSDSPRMPKTSLDSSISRSRSLSSPRAGAPNSPVEEAPSGPWTWQWDIFRGNDESRLPSVALELLRPSLAGGGIDLEAATICSAKLCAAYAVLPFHSAYHGVATLQVASMFAHTMPFMLDALSDFDVFLLGIAALGHDAGHRGFNNMYEVSSGSPIALMHGIDGPVLERFHAKNTLSALEDSGALTHLAPDVRAAAQHTVTAAIMATDMSRHDSVVSELARCGALGMLAPDTLMGTLVHVADLSAQAFPRVVSLAWTERITIEFSRQVDNEKLAGLPSLPLMLGLNEPLKRASMQASFVTFVVAPLWRALSALADGSLDEPMNNVMDNMRYYVAERDRLIEAAKGKSSMLSFFRVSASIRGTFALRQTGAYKAMLKWTQGAFGKSGGAASGLHAHSHLAQASGGGYVSSMNPILQAAQAQAAAYRKSDLTSVSKNESGEMDGATEDNVTVLEIPEDDNNPSETTFAAVDSHDRASNYGDVLAGALPPFCSPRVSSSLTAAHRANPLHAR